MSACSATGTLTLHPHAQALATRVDKREDMLRQQQMALVRGRGGALSGCPAGARRGLASPSVPMRCRSQRSRRQRGALYQWTIPVTRHSADFGA